MASFRDPRILCANMCAKAQSHLRGRCPWSNRGNSSANPSSHHCTCSHFPAPCQRPRVLLDDRLSLEVAW